MKEMKQWKAIAAGTAMAAVLAAGGITAAAEEEVTITYANFNASGGQEETLEAMYEAFHEEYPNITVQIETIGFDDYFTQMQTRVAGGTAPDCYELNIENFAAYANKGFLPRSMRSTHQGIMRRLFLPFMSMAHSTACRVIFLMLFLFIIKICSIRQELTIRQMSGHGRTLLRQQRPFALSMKIRTVFTNR